MVRNFSIEKFSKISKTRPLVEKVYCRSIKRVAFTLLTLVFKESCFIWGSSAEGYPLLFTNCQFRIHGFDRPAFEGRKGTLLQMRTRWLCNTSSDLSNLTEMMLRTIFYEFIQKVCFVHVIYL